MSQEPGSLIGLARFTVPVHLLLPLGLWGLAKLDEVWAGGALLAIHLAFPLVLAVGWRWWWGRGPELAALLVLDHVATFVGAAVLLEAIG